MICTSREPSHSVICPVKVIVGQVRPGMPSRPSKQARKALDFRIHVLLATLDDHAARHIACDDVHAFVIAGDAEHAHRMIMREQNVPDRLVGHAAHVLHEIAGHFRRGARVDDKNEIIADDHAGIRIAFRRQRVDARRKFGECFLLLREVVLTREAFRSLRHMTSR